MGIDDVHEMFPDLPYMKLDQAKLLDQFLKENHLTRCLELGFYHGKSSAFIAAILRDIGQGHLLTIDKKHSLQREPAIHDVLDALDLASWVTVACEHRSYTWKLMSLLEQEERPRFDFCYVDAAHTWDDTGFAFFLIDKLLEPGGWLIFDDIDFEYESIVEKDAPMPEFLSRMGQKERTTKQVRRVWELLVKDHPGYGSFFEHGNWAFTRKNLDV